MVKKQEWGRRRSDNQAYPKHKPDKSALPRGLEVVPGTKRIARLTLDQEELLTEWKEKQGEIEKEIIERYGYTTGDTDKQVQQGVNERGEKIRRVLSSGLDVGGIVKLVEGVILKKYKDDIYFGTSDGRLYKVGEHIQ